MSFQTIGLVIIFLIGCFSSCLQFFPGQTQTKNQPENIRKSMPATAGFERASALLDYGQSESASKMYNEFLQKDLKEKSPRVAVDLNNEAVALYLSARSQSDPGRVPELLLLAQDCLAASQKYAQELNLSDTQLAVLYNQSILLDLLGEHSKAKRMLAIASMQRRHLKPTLSTGLLP